MANGFMRGAVPTPIHRILAAAPFRAAPAPPQMAWVPAQLDVWGNTTYGCHSADTEVLTEDGWTRWPDYDGKSLLGTMNQQTGLLEFQLPLSLQRYEHDGPMAFSNHAGLDFALTGDHRMFYRPYRIAKQGRTYIPGASGYGPYQFGQIKTLPPRSLIPGATTGFLGIELKSLAIDGRTWEGWDFLRLLAVILSDGWVESANRNKVAFCCFRDDRREMVASLAHRLGIAEAPYRRGVWTLSNAALASWLRANCYSGETFRSPFKRVPELVKVACQGQIEEFLKYFGDSSGPNRESRQFYSSSQRMIDDLQELLLRVGKRGTIYSHGIREEEHPNEEGVMIVQKHPSFTLHEYLESDITIKRPNVACGDYKGEVFCATVPNSTLITRRNGRILISGNCCVTSEEAFAKACYNPEIFIPPAIMIAWAKKGGFLNGAALPDVMNAMQTGGFQIGGQQYNDGPYAGVNYADEATLQAALAQGPVKIAIDANALPSSAGNHNGWYAPPGHGHFRNTDHCVSIAGYGPAGYLFDQLKTAVPPAWSSSSPGYLLFTWGTIGFVDHNWLMSTCAEAWLRNPGTMGVPPLPGPAPVAPLDWSMV